MEDLWGKIKKSVIEGVTTAAEKTEEYSKLGKVKFDILAVKRKISKNFTELGGIVYGSVKDGTVDKVIASDEAKTIFESLKELEGELAEKEALFDEMKTKDNTGDDAEVAAGECTEEEI